MEDKILNFQFELVSAKRTHPSYSDGSDQDEPETQHERLNSQKWCNCKNCENMPTSLECVCCHEIPKAKTFHFKGKARLSSSTAALEFLAKLAKNICEGNHFLVEFFSEISQRSFLSLSL